MDGLGSDNLQPVESSEKQPNTQVPKCLECGRQDETIRTVAFPYVISVLILTFRRSFAGTWCLKHRRQKQIFATLITSAIGWFGIPFGVIYTPAALLKLFNGGEQPNQINFSNLVKLGNFKLENNDPTGAILCFEESLKFQEDSQMVSNIKKIRFEHSIQRNVVDKKTNKKVTLLILLKSLSIGIAVGFLDIIFTFFYDVILQNSYSLITLIASWIPFIVLSIIGGILINQILEISLNETNYKKRNLYKLLGLSTGVFAFYGISHGSIISEGFIHLLIDGSGETILLEIIVAVVTIFFGGFFRLIDVFDFQFISDAIYFVFLIIILVIYLTSTIKITLKYIKWQTLLSDIENSEIDDSPDPITGKSSY